MGRLLDEMESWRGIVQDVVAGSVTYLLYELQVSWVADGINKLES